MAKWSAEPSCWEAAEDPILVTLPTSEAGRTPGRMGCSIVTGLRGFDIPQVAKNLDAY